MTFRSEADAAQLTWKQTSPLLPEPAREDGYYTAGGPPRALCLPSEYAELNLIESARGTALSRFMTDGILWHQGMNGGPTTHLCSSQLQCVNALAPFVADAEGLRNLLGSVLPIDEILPFGISGPAAADAVVFEWIGLQDYLGESSGGKRSRGAHFTSADAAVRFRNHRGETEIALIEWKYTERYSCGALPGGKGSLAKRMATYSPWWTDRGPLRLDVMPYEDIFTEPLYQLFRLQCLASEMEKHRELGAARVRLVVAAPGRNTGFWNAVPHAYREAFPDLAALWHGLQREVDRFHVLDTATLVGDNGFGVADFRHRYAHLARAVDAELAPPEEDADQGVDPLADFHAAVADTRALIDRVFGSDSLLARVACQDLSDVEPAALRRTADRLGDIAELCLELHSSDLASLDQDPAPIDDVWAAEPLRDPNNDTFLKPSGDKQRPSAVASNNDIAMDTARLKAWAQRAGCEVQDHADSGRGLPAKLLRFRWNDGLAVGVGCEADGAVRIHAVVDGLAWYLSEATAAGPMHVILGLDVTPSGTAVPIEHLHAVRTVAAKWAGTPAIRLWTMNGDGSPVEREVTPARFTTPTPQKWANLLQKVATQPVEGMAAELVQAVQHPGFALYPKLTGSTAEVPWQMRLDGLDIGRTGNVRTVLRFNLKPQSPLKEPYQTWAAIVGRPERAFPRSELTTAVGMIENLARSWTGPVPGAVLGHGSAEHALEAHVLSERLRLRSRSGTLRTAVTFRSGMLGAAQFPTLWGDVTGPPRYLDALMVDDHQRPWAVELKDQFVGGGHGRYLRHGISQAVLYRHYIRAATELDAWFANHGLDRNNCQAALAFPVAASAAAPQVLRHRKLAEGFDVEVIEFAPAGSPSAHP